MTTIVNSEIFEHALTGDDAAKEIRKLIRYIVNVDPVLSPLAGGLFFPVPDPCGDNQLGLLVKALADNGYSARFAKTYPGGLYTVYVNMIRVTDNARTSYRYLFS